MKLLIIGIDGMSDRVFWDREFKMSFLRNSLMPKSLYGISIATVQQNQKGRFDPHTGPNWSTIYTGVDCKIHGVDYGGWLQKHKSHGDLKVQSIWYMIREYYELGLIGMPVTYPAFECEWMISGFPNSEVTKNSVYPKHMAKGLKGFMVDYGDGKTSWRNKLHDGWGKGESDKFFEIEFEKIKLARKLNAVNPVDVLAFGSTVVDKACHIFTMFSEPAMETYKKVDKMIAKLVEYFDPENVFIVSDHGFQAIKGRHAVEGIYLWYNKDNPIEDRITQPLSILDMAGMILTILEIKLKTGMSSETTRYEQEDKEGIVNRLKQLGYL